MPSLLPKTITDYVASLTPEEQERLLVIGLKPDRLVFPTGEGCLIGVARGIADGQTRHDAAVRELSYRAWQGGAATADIYAGIGKVFNDACADFGTDRVQQAIRDYIIEQRLAGPVVTEPAMVRVG